MKTTFEECIKIILEWEGGYVNHPDDPGGETNFGIARKFYPSLDIVNLTRGAAIQIYKADYWDKNKIESFPESIRLTMFDMAVNMGYKNAIKVLQTTLNKYGRKIEIDGIAGPKTFEALSILSNGFKEIFIFSLTIDRLNYYINLVSARSNMVVFLKGWAKRTNSILFETFND